MITITNISKIYGTEYILKDVNLTINVTDKIGVVGRNGVGKTTLLKIIENDEIATDGYVEYAHHTVAFLSQEKQLNLANTLADEIKLMTSKYDNMYQEMQQIVNEPNFATDDILIKRYGQLETRYDAMDGYKIESMVQKVLGIFGFGVDVYTKQISELSGGEKTRLALVKIIMQDPDFLILDEPTNHLDVETIEWLEEYLRLKAKGVVLVSHDRFFLQKVCNRIVEVENKQIEIYKMNYEKYVQEKHRRYEFNLSSFLNQQDEIKKLEEYIIKNNKTPSKIGQVNDRKRKLANLKILEKPLYNNEKVSFEIEGFRHKKAHYVDMLDASIGTSDGILNNINFTVVGGDRIGIIGDNGAGKTTMIKTITKQIPHLSGNVILHPKIKIGYFEQEHTTLDNEKTVFVTIEELMPFETATMVRKHLAKFLFKREDVFKKVVVLSGGEKVRLIFAMFVLKQYDMIIMDEPTNHLDLSAKEELESVLKQYKGTLIIISHDRYFLNQVINTVFYIKDGSYQIFEGNYEYFLKHKQEIKVEKTHKKKTIKKSNNNKTKKYEKQILSLEIQKTTYNELVGKKEIYESWEKVNELQDKINAIDLEIEKLYNLLLKESYE